MGVNIRVNSSKQFGLVTDRQTRLYIKTILSDLSTNENDCVDWFVNAVSTALGNLLTDTHIVADIGDLVSFSVNGINNGEPFDGNIFFVEITGVTYATGGHIFYSVTLPVKNKAIKLAEVQGDLNNDFNDDFFNN